MQDNQMSRWRTMNDGFIETTKGAAEAWLQTRDGSYTNRTKELTMDLLPDNEKLEDSELQQQNTMNW